MRFAVTLLLVAQLCVFGAAVAGPIAGRVEIRQGDAGTMVPLSVGQQLSVTLPVVSGTGYEWTPARGAFLPLTFLGGSMAPAKMVGGGTEQTLIFAANAPGTGTLELDYVRPWLKTAPPLKRFTVNVNIAPASN